MTEAVLTKSFTQGFQRTNAQVVRKEISFLVRLLKQNFVLGSLRVHAALNPWLRLPLSTCPWICEIFILHESIPARVLRHPGMPGPEAGVRQ